MLSIGCLKEFRGKPSGESFGGEFMDKILAGNRAWSKRVNEKLPGFFEKLARQQAPRYLWIGCADSRVPANQIVDMPPGEVFVHRNIANVVAPSDLNCLSVMQYAVEVLGVRHIIVCGHYGCGGVAAALSPEDHGLIDNWLNHIRTVKRLHTDCFHDGMSDQESTDRLCELNVIEGVRNVADTTIVREAWQRDQDVEVHGLIYSLENGVLDHLCACTKNGFVEGPLEDTDLFRQD